MELTDEERLELVEMLSHPGADESHSESQSQHLESSQPLTLLSRESDELDIAKDFVDDL